MTNQEAIKYLQQIYPNGGHCWLDEQRIEAIGMAINALQEEPVSEDLEEASLRASIIRGQYIPKEDLDEYPYDAYAQRMFKLGAKWQKQQDQSTIELAEDHAYFSGRTKTIDEIKEALLSEVLPCFMHGGEADEVVAKLDEVLNQKK